MSINHSSRRIGSVRLRSFLANMLWVVILAIGVPRAGLAEQAVRSYASYGPFRYAMVHVLGGINPQDAKVAIKVNWSKHLEKVFPGMTSEFEILPDVASAARKIADGLLHGLSLDIAEYLELRETSSLKPVFISSRQSTPLESYLLLVRRDISWERLSAQPARRLITEKRESAYLGTMWMDTLLQKRNLPLSRTYFTDVALAAKPARIVLPVFFGQADACLVPESAYNTMIELNPQIEQRTTILERSPGFIKTIHCTTDLMPKHMVDRFIQKGVDMEDTVDGRQLLLIFHVKKNFVFKSEYLINSERIFREYHQMAAPADE